MRSIRWLIAAAMIALVVGGNFLPKQPVASFQTLAEMKAKVHAIGYHCTTDAFNGALSNGFLISREAMAPDQVCGLCKIGTMSPAWKGRIWVTLNPDCWQLQTIPDDAGTRVFGKLIAFGDQELLDEVEEALISGIVTQ